MPKLTDEHIRKLLGTPPSETTGLVSTDELQALLLQVSLALLMVFIVATFVFRTALILQPNEEVYARLDDFTGQVAGSVNLEELHQDRRRLLESLIQIYNQERATYGLTEWLTVDENGAIVTVLDDLFDGREIVPESREKLIAATTRARERLARKTEIADEWFAFVERQINQPALIARDRAWLNREISKRIDLLELDTLRLHNGMLAHVTQYYYDNPDAVDDGMITALVQRYPRLSTAEKRRTLDEIQTRVKAMARRTLRDRGVVLLE